MAQRPGLNYVGIGQLGRTCNTHFGSYASCWMLVPLLYEPSNGWHLKTQIANWSSTVSLFSSHGHRLCIVSATNGARVIYLINFMYL